MKALLTSRVVSVLKPSLTPASQYFKSKGLLWAPALLLMFYCRKVANRWHVSTFMSTHLIIHIIIHLLSSGYHTHLQKLCMPAWLNLFGVMKLLHNWEIEKRNKSIKNSNILSTRSHQRGRKTYFEIAFVHISMKTCRIDHLQKLWS